MGSNVGRTPHVRIFNDGANRQQAIELIKQASRNPESLEPGSASARSFQQSLLELFSADGAHTMQQENAFKLGLVNLQRDFWEDIPSKLMKEAMRQNVEPGSPLSRQFQMDAAVANQMMQMLNAEASRLKQTLPRGATELDSRRGDTARLNAINAEKATLAQQQAELVKTMGDAEPASPEARQAEADLVRLALREKQLVAEELNMKGANPFEIQDALSTVDDKLQLDLINGQIAFWQNADKQLDAAVQKEPLEPRSPQMRRIQADKAKVAMVMRILRHEQQRLVQQIENG